MPLEKLIIFFNITGLARHEAAWGVEHTGLGWAPRDLAEAATPGGLRAIPRDGDYPTAARYGTAARALGDL